MDRKSVQSGIWLIGIGILLLTGFWWPGILILAGISMLVGTLLPDNGPTRVAMPDPAQEPPASVQADEPKSEVEDEREIPSALGGGYQPDLLTHSTALLPAECPMCGGPVLAREEDLVWTGYQTARCPFCATELPLPAPQPSL